MKLDEFESQSDEEPHGITPDQIGLNATKDHRSGMVSRILSLMLYLPVTRILLHFQEAIESSENDKWMEAMLEENESLSKNKLGS